MVVQRCARAGKSSPRGAAIVQLSVRGHSAHHSDTSLSGMVGRLVDSFSPMYASVEDPLHALGCAVQDEAPVLVAPPRVSPPPLAAQQAAHAPVVSPVAVAPPLDVV